MTSSRVPFNPRPCRSTCTAIASLERWIVPLKLKPEPCAWA